MDHESCGGFLIGFFKLISEGQVSEHSCTDYKTYFIIQVISYISSLCFGFRQIVSGFSSPSSAFPEKREAPRARLS